MSASVILLHAADNVLVARRSVASGEAIELDGASFIVRAPVPVGHKIARVDVHVGDKIVKYGMSIGSATEELRAGDWVHLHNMRSDYISAHTRDAEDKAQ